MIPADKHDLTSIATMQCASDDEVLKNAEQLLQWLQDINWPVFRGIVGRLSTLGDDLVSPISAILAGSDSTWKANIIGYLIPAFRPEAQKLYIESLTEVLKRYDENDLRDGVIDFVEIQLSKYREDR